MVRRGRWLQRESDGESEGETPEQHRDRGRDAGAETSCARARPAAALFTSFRAAVPQHRPYGLGNALRRALAPWLLCPLSPRETKVFSRVVPLGRRGSHVCDREGLGRASHQRQCSMYGHAPHRVLPVRHNMREPNLEWESTRHCGMGGTPRVRVDLNDALRSCQACRARTSLSWAAGTRLVRAAQWRTPFYRGRGGGEAREGASVSGAQALFRGLNAQY